MSKHTLEYGMKARQFDTSDFQDQSVTRILKKLSVIERAALPENELKEVSGKGTDQERVSFAIILWEDTSFSQNFKKCHWAATICLGKGDRLVPPTQSQNPCLQLPTQRLPIPGCSGTWMFG